VTSNTNAMQTIANTSNSIVVIKPTDDDLDQSPYDYPTDWIARALDELIAPDSPIARENLTRTAPDGRFIGKAVTSFADAVTKYSDAVLMSDPVQDKSNAARRVYRTQHVVTRMSVPVGNRPESEHSPSERWDDRTFAQGPIVLTLANGPFYAVALVLRGGGTLYIQSLGSDGTSVQVP
jgi:hypothetical protein